MEAALNALTKYQIELLTHPVQLIQRECQKTLKLMNEQIELLRCQLCSANDQIEAKNQDIKQHKSEIQFKNDQLIQKNQQIEQSKSDIQLRNDELKECKKKIVKHQSKETMMIKIIFNLRCDVKKLEEKISYNERRSEYEEILNNEIEEKVRGISASLKETDSPILQSSLTIDSITSLIQTSEEVSPEETAAEELEKMQPTVRLHRIDPEIDEDTLSDNDDDDDGPDREVDVQTLSDEDGDEEEHESIDIRVVRETTSEEPQNMDIQGEEEAQVDKIRKVCKEIQSILNESRTDEYANTDMSSSDLLPTGLSSSDNVHDSETSNAAEKVTSIDEKLLDEGVINVNETETGDMAVDDNIVDISDDTDEIIDSLLQGSDDELPDTSLLMDDSVFEVFNDKTMSEVNKPIEVGVASEESGGKMRRKRRKEKEVRQLNSDMEKRKSSRLSDDKIKKMLESFDTTSFRVTKSLDSGKKMMKTRVKKTKCNQCSNCLREDCGTCVYCLDKPKFGGPLRLKQKCVERRCNNMSNFY